jgi:sugar/nucleoside kinase (ribokinase family)
MQCGNGALMNRVVSFCAREKTPLAILAATSYGAEQTASFLAEMPALPTLLVFANTSEGIILKCQALNAPHTGYIETDGKKGGIVYLPHTGSDSPRCGYTFSAVTPAAPVIDETGAGDIFAGVFLAQWFSQGTSDSAPAVPLAQICERAAYAAAQVTTVPLCKVSEPLFPTP